MACSSGILTNDLDKGKKMNFLMLAVDAVLFVGCVLLVYAAATTLEDDGRRK